MRKNRILNYMFGRTIKNIKDKLKGVGGEI